MFCKRKRGLFSAHSDDDSHCRFTHFYGSITSTWQMHGNVLKVRIFTVPIRSGVMIRMEVNVYNTQCMVFVSFTHQTLQLLRWIRGRNY